LLHYYHCYINIIALFYNNYPECHGDDDFIKMIKKLLEKLRYSFTGAWSLEHSLKQHSLGILITTHLTF